MILSTLLFGNLRFQICGHMLMLFLIWIYIKARATPKFVAALLSKGSLKHIMIYSKQVVATFTSIILGALVDVYFKWMP